MSHFGARIVMATAALNINGVLEMTGRSAGLGSMILLIGSIYLITKHGGFAWSTPFNLIAVAIVTYLVLGTMIVDPHYASDTPLDFHRTYIASLLIIWAMAGYVAWLGSGPRLVAFLQFVRNTFLIAAASVWGSPYLYKHYVALPVSHADRMGGFFMSPNEAGFTSCIALVLVLALPFRNILVQIPAALLALGAVVLTLSKTSMSAAIILLAWHFLRRIRLSLGLPIAATIVVALFAVEPVQFVEKLAQNLDLASSQKNRITAVGKILTGQIDSSVSTGRTVLWQIGIDRALDKFPFGNGLGSHHALKDGIIESNIWLGAHNTFLVFWGESGILPGLLLVAGMLTTLRYSLIHARGAIEFPLLLVLLADMMGSQDAMGLRYGNLALGIVLGLVGYVAAVERGRGPLPARPGAPVARPSAAGRLHGKA